VASSGPVRGYRRGAPDLAVEVASPSDRYTEVEEKVALWFRHGARMVVEINPRRSTVAAYRSPTQVRLLTIGDVLDGEEVVPGWLLPVVEIFEDLPPLDDKLPYLNRASALGAVFIDALESALSFSRSRAAGISPRDRCGRR
jgi:hypothetical protein